MKQSREFLYNRHQLSHQQINTFLKERQNELIFKEKLHQSDRLSIFLGIVNFFIEKDIWFLPLKGPMLSYRIYGDATCRISGDFDFLIKKKDVYSTIEIFRNEGYEYRTGKLLHNESRLKKKESLPYLFTFYHPKTKIIVETQWRLFNDPIIEFNEIEEILKENIRQFTFSGKYMNQFTLELELLYIIIHRGFQMWRKLKWLIDVHEIVNRFQIDKIKFERLTERLGAQRMVGLCNAMLRHNFPGTQYLPVDYPVPEWFIKFCIQQAEQEEDSPDYRLAFKRRWFLIQALPSRMYKLKRLEELYFSLLKKAGKLFF